jgi:hypothetical protein
MRSWNPVPALLLSVLALLGVIGCTTFTVTVPAPTITGLNPTNVTAGSPAFDLTITGTGIVDGFSEIHFGTVIPYLPHQWTFVAPNSAVIRVGAAFVAEDRVGGVPVSIVNRSGGSFIGGGTATTTFTVTSPLPNVASVVTNLPPPNDQNSVSTGVPPFRMMVTGSGFTTGSLIFWDGVARLTNFVSRNQVTTDVAGSDVGTPRTVQVSVANPTPGGGRSPTSVPFTIYPMYPELVAAGPLLWLLTWQTRVTFDDPPPAMTEAPLNGPYPRPPSSLAPRLSFPAGQWEWADEVINGIRVRDAFFSTSTAFPATSRDFLFANGPRILSGVEVISKTAGTLTLRDGNGRTMTRQIVVGPVQSVATGWFDQPSATITFEFTGGRQIGITAISYLGLP